LLQLASQQRYQCDVQRPSVVILSELEDTHEVVSCTKATAAAVAAAAKAAM
jgi:hypothetical protein